MLDFLIVAFAIYTVIRAMNKLRRRQEQKPGEMPTPPAPSEEPEPCGTPVATVKAGRLQ